MTDNREFYDLNQPEHKIVNQVIRRIEGYLFDNGVGVKFGDAGRLIIGCLVIQYNDLLSKEDQKSGLLDIENQRLRKELQTVANKARNSQQQGQILIAMMIEEVLAK